MNGICGIKKGFMFEKQNTSAMCKLALTVPSERIRNLGYLLDEGKEEYNNKTNNLLTNLRILLGSCPESWLYVYHTWSLAINLEDRFTQLPIFFMCA